MSSNSPISTIEYQISPDFTPDPEQQKAIELCCDISNQNRVAGVTGSAGTGKTSIIKQVHAALVTAGYQVALCAPTGKAAKRITQATGIPASTIHRMLEYSHPGMPDPETGQTQYVSSPKKTSENPLGFDVVLVDEGAMVNRELYRNLIGALPSKGCVRFFGDVNQLPPIEEDGYQGQSSFQQLLNAPHIKKIVLQTNHRQGEGSDITMNGARILRGTPPMQTKEFGIRISDVPIRQVVAMCRQIKDAGETGFDVLSNQIITPGRKGLVGSLALNTLLCELYNPGTNGIMAPRHVWEARTSNVWSVFFAIGQKVIITANIYDLRPTMEERWSEGIKTGSFIEAGDHEMVYNGETGIIEDVSNDTLTINLGDRIVAIPPELEVEGRDGTITVIDPRKSVEHAYAITTHKSQGSEYHSVLYFLSRSAHHNQCRSNFYTGITRAKNIACVVADSASIGRYSLRAKLPDWNKGKK